MKVFHFNSLKIEQMKIKKPIEFVPSSLLKIIEVDDFEFQFKNNPNENFAIFKVQDKSGCNFKLFVIHHQLEELKIEKMLLEELIGCSVLLVKSWEKRVQNANNKSEEKKFIFFDSSDNFLFSEEYKKYKIELDVLVKKKIFQEKKKKVAFEKLKEERVELIKKANGL